VRPCTETDRHTESQRSLNTKFVETFVMLARIGSVRRVAEHLNATPGAISMRLRSLEEELGVTLFDYDRKSLTITPDGTRLLRYAEGLLDATRAMQAAATAGSSEPEGRIRIGVLETAVHTWLPELMKGMRTQLPNVEVDLTVDLTVHLADQLMRGNLDFILRVGSEQGSAFAPVEDLMALPIHWVAKKGLIPKRDAMRRVLGSQLLTQVRGTSPYHAAINLAQQLAARHGMAAGELRISGSPSLAALVSLVREGVGVGIIPGLLVKEQLERGELVELALPAPPAFNVALSHHADAPPIVLRTAEVARQACKAYCRRTDAKWVQHLG
ncbi:MAG: transcriptional regulator, LysR family, partial [Rhizobacter sp.]|nr:transcriptional regulator, LysR family [Rhizobacter sp.]